jgi:hypothetical protein
MILKTKDYMKIVAATALLLSAGLALAELEGAFIAFGVCVFVVLILFLCYY